MKAKLIRIISLTTLFITLTVIRVPLSFAELNSPPETGVGAESVIPLSSEPQATAIASEIDSLINQLGDYGVDSVLEAADKLVAIGKPALPQLLERLNGADVALKGQIVFLLGRMGYPEATLTLMEVLKNDTNAYIRRNATQALGRIGDIRALSALILALSNDTNAGVRTLAAWALGELGDRLAVEGLLAQLAIEKTEGVQLVIVETLGELKDRRATLALISELQALGNLSYKNTVVTSLGELEDSRALPALTEHLNYLQQLKANITEPMVIFQFEQAIKITEEAIAKIQNSVTLEGAKQTIVNVNGAK